MPRDKEETTLLIDLLDIFHKYEKRTGKYIKTLELNHDEKNHFGKSKYPDKLLTSINIIYEGE